MMIRRVASKTIRPNGEKGHENNNDVPSVAEEDDEKTDSVRSWTSDHRKELFRSLLGGDDDASSIRQGGGDKTASKRDTDKNQQDDDDDDEWANRDEGSLQLYNGNDNDEDEVDAAEEEDDSKTNMRTVVEEQEEDEDDDKEAMRRMTSRKSARLRANSWEEDDILQEGNAAANAKEDDNGTREPDAPTREIVIVRGGKRSVVPPAAAAASKTSSGDGVVQGSRTHSRSTQSTSNRRRNTFYDRGSANHDNDNDDEDDTASVATYGVSGILESMGVGGAGMKATSSNQFSHNKTTNTRQRPSSVSRHRHNNNNSTTTSIGWTTTPSTKNHPSNFLPSLPHHHNNNTGISRRSVATSVSSLPVDVASLSHMSHSYGPSTIVHNEENDDDHDDNNSKHSAAAGGWRHSLFHAFGGRMRNVFDVAHAGKAPPNGWNAHKNDDDAGTMVSTDDDEDASTTYSETSCTVPPGKPRPPNKMGPAHAQQQVRMMHVRAGMLLLVLVSTIYFIFQITAMAEHDRRIIRKLRYGARDGTHDLTAANTAVTTKSKDSSSSSSSTNTKTGSKNSSGSGSILGSAVSDNKKKTKRDPEEDEEEDDDDKRNRQNVGSRIGNRLKNFGKREDGLIPVASSHSRKKKRQEEEEESEALAAANDDMFVSGGNHAEHGPKTTTKSTKKGLGNVARLYQPPGVLLEEEEDEESSSSGNRDLDQLLKEKMPAGFQYLVELSSPAQRARPGTPLFWMVPRGGGTVVSDILTYCQGAVLASEVGRAYVDDQLRVMTLNGHKYVNVDTFSADGLAHAKSKGLVESGLAQVIVSSHLHEALDLFSDESHRGRAFVMMRHPVERAVSLYHHLKSAGNPAVAALSLEEYAQSHLVENNWMTRFLSGQTAGDLSMTHLGMAKEVLRRKFLIGLLDQKEVAMKRFEQFFGWTYHDNPAAQNSCRKRVFAGNDLAMESDKTHQQQVREGSQAWTLLEWQNQMDIKLYQYAHHLFGEQGREIFPDVVVGPE